MCYGRLEEGKYEASMGILQRYLTTDDNNGEGRGGRGRGEMSLQRCVIIIIN